MRYLNPAPRVGRWWETASPECARPAVASIHRVPRRRLPSSRAHGTSRPGAEPADHRQAGTARAGRSEGGDGTTHKFRSKRSAYDGPRSQRPAAPSVVATRGRRPRRRPASPMPSRAISAEILCGSCHSSARRRVQRSPRRCVRILQRLFERCRAGSERPRPIAHRVLDERDNALSLSCNRSGACRARFKPTAAQESAVRRWRTLALANDLIAM
jgi:hypothetical protein